MEIKVLMDWKDFPPWVVVKFGIGVELTLSLSEARKLLRGLRVVFKAYDKE